jgi:hypothetical protein
MGSRVAVGGAPGEGTSIVNARSIARLGVLAVGLGIGAAAASMPGSASADSSTDWLSSLDSLLVGAFPAADTSGLNMAVSIDGVTLIQDGTAHAYSGTNGDIAMATGAGDTAYAYGTNNYADVLGTNDTGISGGTSDAAASGSTGDTAFIDGNNDYAFAGGTNGVDDGAEIFGSNDAAEAGSSAAGNGSYDVAYVEGSNLGNANATGASYLVDILKAYGDKSADAAVSNSNFLSELLSPTDAVGTAAGSSNLVTELVSLFDPAAAADSGNLLTDLASLF